VTAAIISTELSTEFVDKIFQPIT